MVRVELKLVFESSFVILFIKTRNDVIKDSFTHFRALPKTLKHALSFEKDHQSAV